jgi:hypothetical protein
MPQPLLRRTAWLSAATVAAALSGVGLAGCGPPDPFTAPACTQIPADAVRATVTDLGTVPEESPRTDPTGAEYGRLPATDPNGFSYWCHWPATSPDKNHRSAFTVSVGVLQGTDLELTTKAVMNGSQGPLLTSTAPGQGRARTLPFSGDGKYGSADWICPHIPGYYTTQRLTVDVYRPKHPDHPEIDAKTLAEAIIPLIGCAPGDTTPAPSGPTPTGPATVPPSSTPSH